MSNNFYSIIITKSKLFSLGDKIIDLKKAIIELQCEMVAERNLVNPKEITWIQYDILHYLSKQSEVLPSDLSLILGVYRSKLSKFLKGLKSIKTNFELA